MSKLCINCKWSFKHSLENGDADYECKSPKNVEVSLIDGSNRPIYWMCEAHRSSEKYGCTEAGLFYEER
jgi:hypothetical protein